MPAEDMEKVADPKSGWTIEQKWRALKPYYECSWNTAYCECLRIAMRDIYGIEDLTKDVAVGDSYLGKVTRLTNFGAFVEIGPGKEDPGHRHPFEQCGVVIEGRIEMFVAEDRRVLQPMETYFIPAGAFHGWKTFDVPARILDVSSKPI